MFISKTKNLLLFAMVFLVLLELAHFKTGSFLLIATSISKITVFTLLFYLIKNYFSVESDLQEKEIKILYDKLEKDNTTGVFDKASLYEWYAAKKDYIEKSDKNLSIIIIEVNNLKKIEEEQGSSVSNMVLFEMGELINNSTRRMIDFVVRIDESKFAILCFEKEENALIIGERVSKKANEYKWSNEQSISCSIAVSEIDLRNNFEEELIHAEEVLSNARKNNESNISRRNFCM